MSTKVRVVAKRKTEPAQTPAPGLTAEPGADALFTPSGTPDGAAGEISAVPEKKGPEPASTAVETGSSGTFHASAVPEREPEPHRLPQPDARQTDWGARENKTGKTNLFFDLLRFLRSRTGRQFVIDILIAALIALPSAFSLTILLYLRKPIWILSVYYEDPARNFLLDVFTEYMSRASVLLIYIILFAAFFSIGRLARKPSIAGLVVAGIISLNIDISLSMEFGGLKEIFLPVGLWGNGVFLLGCILLVSRTIDLLYRLLGRGSSRLRTAESVAAEGRGRAFLHSFCCLIVCWLPCMVLCYPGSAPSDTITQIESWLGRYSVDASHPLLATLFYGVIYSLGRALGGDMKGMFMTLLVQTSICAAAISYYADFIGRITASRKWQIAAVLYFALTPTWQCAMQAVLKDVLHTGFFMLFYVWYLKALEEDGTGKRTFLNLFLGAFLISYTRKAAFYIALLAIIAVILVQRKRFAKQAIACLLCTIAVYYAPNVLIYPFLDVTPPREVENYSMQLQQTAYYCITYQDEMTQEEIDIINTTLDFDTIIQNFTVKLSDPVKATYHGTDEDHAVFWNLYRQLFLRHPLTMIRATIMCTYAHLDPWNLYIFDFNLSSGPDADVSYANEHRADLMAYWELWQKVPLVRMIMATGLSTWITMALSGYAVRRKSWRILLGILPAFVLFVGLFMSHVNGMIRYGYPLIAVSPLLLAWAVHAGSLSGGSESAAPAVPAGVPKSAVCADDAQQQSPAASDDELPRLYMTAAKAELGRRSDEAWLKQLNSGDIASAERGLKAYEMKVCAAELLHGEKADSGFKALRRMKEQLERAKDAQDLADQIRFYLQLWDDLADTPKGHLRSAMRTGEDLLTQAERMRQDLPDFKPLDPEPLCAKLAELRQAYERET